MLKLAQKTIKLIVLRPGRAFLILRMALWVAVLSLIVKFVSLPRALQIVSPRNPVNPSADKRIEADLAGAIDALLGLRVLFFSPVCWKRAAILHRYLNLKGQTTTINFGLRKGTDGSLDGHAWLEADGRTVCESEACAYTVTYVFPSNANCEIELAAFSKNHLKLRNRDE